MSDPPKDYWQSRGVLIGFGFRMRVNGWSSAVPASRVSGSISGDSHEVNSHIIQWNNAYASINFWVAENLTIQRVVSAFTLRSSELPFCPTSLIWQSTLLTVIWYVLHPYSQRLYSRGFPLLEQLDIDWTQSPSLLNEWALLVSADGSARCYPMAAATRTRNSLSTRTESRKVNFTDKRKDRGARTDQEIIR